MGDGLGISSVSGSHTATGPYPVLATRSRYAAIPDLLGLTFSPNGTPGTLIGRPPARACDSSMSVWPLTLLLAIRPADSAASFLAGSLRDRPDVDVDDDMGEGVLASLAVVCCVILAMEGILVNLVTGDRFRLSAWPLGGMAALDTKPLEVAAAVLMRAAALDDLCERNGRLLLVKGFLVDDDLCCVGEGGQASSPSDSWAAPSLAQSSRFAAALDAEFAAKMLPWCVRGFPWRRGDSDSEAMAMGLGDCISTSMGVPIWPANMVCARWKGVRAARFRSLLMSGLSAEYESSVMSVVEGNSSPLPSADELCAWSDFAMGDSICTSCTGGGGVLLRRLSSSFSTRFLTSSSNCFLSLSTSALTWRSISSRALTSHSLRIDASNSCRISRSLWCRSSRRAYDITANVGGVNAIMTAIQGQNQLAKDAPDKALLRPLALVFHVQVQVLARLEVLAVVVGDDVRVAEVREDLELGVQLLALFLRHSDVRDFFAAHDEAVGLAADLADDAKGAMA
ncbi:hypothetical protein CCMA1212_006799 [Trichoderma ghanense]|uniref:Uncharacterized protein n=1 Tax=Trichoderma ghanense TaxID=65468 RepID=A0ABY2GZ93_9HYPO